MAKVKKKSKRQLRQEARAKELVGKQLAAYKRMVEAGIGIVQRWANAADVDEPHVSILQCLSTFVDASYNSKKKPQNAKTFATAVAIRAAYLYGLHDGRFPKKDEEESDGLRTDEVTDRKATR